MKINQNSLNNLKYNRSSWKNSETIAVRVPKVFKQEILDYARQLDNSQNTNQSNSTVHEELKELITKVDNKEKGYKSNSAGNLIKELKAIAERL